MVRMDWLLKNGISQIMEIHRNTLILTIMILHEKVIILVGVQCKTIGMGSYQNLSDMGEIL